MAPDVFYVDMCIDDLWEVARSLPPDSAHYGKVRRAIDGLIQMANRALVARGCPGDQFTFYANDLDAYEGMR